MKTGPSVTDAARGRMSQGIKLIQEGGFEGVYKSTFGMDVGEQLRKTYACYLSTSTGPVAGTLYISNLKFSFCSDRPLAYAPATGQQAWSYYKVSNVSRVDFLLMSVRSLVRSDHYHLHTKIEFSFLFPLFLSFICIVDCLLVTKIYFSMCSWLSH